MRLVSAILLFVISSAGIAAIEADSSAESSLVGHWHGETSLGSRELTFEASFRNDGNWSGTMQLLGINTRPLELQDIAVDGDTVTFRLPATSRSSGGASPGMSANGGGRSMSGGGFLFSGRLVGDEIVGTMATGPMSSAMKMSRKD